MSFKLLHIIGARPQFIKYFPLQQAIRRVAADRSIENKVVHTGQHYDYRMSKIFFDELGILEPDYHLEVGSGCHGRQTALVLQRVEEVLIDEKPDVVMVYGDTTSTLGGALAAAKLHIPVAHVEAGLRSFNKRMPEEVNRVLADHISTYLFCPSETAVTNLRREGFLSENTQADEIPSADHPFVAQVGDVMYDMLLLASRYAEDRSRILDELKIETNAYDLLTLHRAENTDDPRRLEEIIAFVNEITTQRSVIFPMHPRMSKAYAGVHKSFADNVRIIEPLGYFDLVMILKNASRLLTDSGGMQKEAYWLQVPCVTLRDETEWVETIQSGWNILYRNYRNERQMRKKTEVYGDGHAADKIIHSLLEGRSLNYE